MENKFINRYNTFCRCLENLKKSQKADPEADFVLEGTVQNFNLAFDISCKVMKDILVKNMGITDFAIGSPREVLKTAYVNGVKITGTRTPDNNYTFKDSYGNEVKVPGGFKVVNPEDNVTDGIIIEDVSAGDSNTKGSQFVWIPVGDVYTDEEHTDANKKTIKLGR